MPRSVVYCLWSLVCLTVGCAEDPLGAESCKFQPTVKDGSTPSKSEPGLGADVPDVRIYDGLTLSQWRERIKNLDPASPDSGQAVTGLLAIVKDSDAPWFSRRQAALTLGRIGPPAENAVPVLTELLKQTHVTDEESPRSWSLRALALFGPVAKPATSALIGILNDADQPIKDRLLSIEALGRLGPEQSNVISALLTALGFRASSRLGVSNDEAGRIREAAANALGLIGPSASAAVPALIRATGDQRESLRRAAVFALGRMKESGNIALPRLAELIILDRSAAVRDHAAAALASMGTPSIPLLQRLLQDTDSEVRWRAAESLGKIGPAAKESYKALGAVLNDGSAQVRMAGIQAIWKINSDAATVVPALIRELTHADRQIRIQAFRQLTSMGSAARIGIGQLTALLDDERSYVRQSAAMTLQKLQALD